MVGNTKICFCGHINMEVAFPAMIYIYLFRNRGMKTLVHTKLCMFSILKNIFPQHS